MSAASWRCFFNHCAPTAIDVLIVDEIGKDISGTGMDAKVIGRMRVHGVDDPQADMI